MCITVRPNQSHHKTHTTTRATCASSLSTASYSSSARGQPRVNAARRGFSSHSTLRTLASQTLYASRGGAQRSCLSATLSNTPPQLHRSSRLCGRASLTRSHNRLRLRIQPSTRTHTPHRTHVRSRSQSVVLSPNSQTTVDAPHTPPPPPLTPYCATRPPNTAPRLPTRTSYGPHTLLITLHMHPGHRQPTTSPFVWVLSTTEPGADRAAPTHCQPRHRDGSRAGRQWCRRAKPPHAR